MWKRVCIHGGRRNRHAERREKKTTTTTTHVARHWRRDKREVLYYVVLRCYSYIYTYVCNFHRVVLYIIIRAFSFSAVAGELLYILPRTTTLLFFRFSAIHARARIYYILHHHIHRPAAAVADTLGWGASLAAPPRARCRRYTTCVVWPKTTTAGERLFFCFAYTHTHFLRPSVHRHRRQGTFAADTARRSVYTCACVRARRFTSHETL